MLFLRLVILLNCKNGCHLLKNVNDLFMLFALSGTLLANQVSPFDQKLKQFPYVQAVLYLISVQQNVFVTDAASK